MKDEKELSEHRMLVDLGRNDIHRISKTGTSQITKLMTIERYEHVMHIVSEVTGELKPNLSPMSVIASLLPTVLSQVHLNLELYREYTNLILIKEVSIAVVLGISTVIII